jgi:hypothetical protein
VLRLSYVLNLRVLRSAKYRVSPKTTNADITPMNHMVSRDMKSLPHFGAQKHESQARDLIGDVPRVVENGEAGAAIVRLRSFSMLSSRCLMFSRGEL